MEVRANLKIVSDEVSNKIIVNFDEIFADRVILSGITPYGVCKFIAIS